jgi:hypothetical protein
VKSYFFSSRPPSFFSITAAAVFQLSMLSLGLFVYSSTRRLSCREYILNSKEELKSSFPFSTSALVADSIGCGKPIDSRKETADKNDRLDLMFENR